MPSLKRVMQSFSGLALTRKYSSKRTIQAWQVIGGGKELLRIISILMPGNGSKSETLALKLRKRSDDDGCKRKNGAGCSNTHSGSPSIEGMRM